MTAWWIEEGGDRRRERCRTQQDQYRGDLVRLGSEGDTFHMSHYSFGCVFSSIMQRCRRVFTCPLFSKLFFLFLFNFSL